MKRLSIVLIFLLLPFALFAGDGYRRFDNKIKKMLMSGMDTTFIALPSTSWEVPLIANQRAYYTTLQMGNEQLVIDPRTVDLGITVGYHGLDLMYTFALDKKSDNFYIDYYDNYWGVSINIGNYALNVKNQSECDLRSHSMMVMAYYALNGSRYSHPATVYGNYIQKRSAGSPLIHAWYDYHSYRQGDVPLEGMEFDETGHLARIHQGAVTAGYGYNFAFMKGKAVINAHAGIGVALPWALATNGSMGFVLWLNENLRFNFLVSNYFQKSWMEKYYKFESNTWYSTLGFYICFGK